MGEELSWTSGVAVLSIFSLSLTLGLVVASYRKTHLCDVEIPGQGPMRESNSTMPGRTLEPPVSTPAGKVGV